MKPRPSVLLVDDEPFVLESLRRLLAAVGFDATTSGDAAGALERLRSREFDVLVTDLALPGTDGIALLRQVRDLAADLPVIVLTGVGTVSTAVAAMKEGALDFLSKPVEPEAFLALLRRAVEHGDLVKEVRVLRATVREFGEPPLLVGASRPFADLLHLVDSVAATDARVLILGESGTGKELVAHAIHARSRRARYPFVRVNCAAIPSTLFESELFGHRRGAFTGATEDRGGRLEEAHGGTLALDEVGTLPLEAQAKLLRAIETGEYQPVGDSRARRADVRAIAITNEDLARRVREGTFREDLYFRLNVFPLHVPPLRDRKEDIPPLAEHFLRRFASREGRPPRRLHPSALEVLSRHDWPGNVRELRNALERAAILETGEEISAGGLAAILEGGLLRPPGAEPATPAAAPETLRIRDRTDALERTLITQALARTTGRKREAAALLGIDPRNLAYYLRKHGISGEEES
ncbi:MAG TPA: sigma-54 dependent transcriptional regulator [Planctomycetota bacterium]|nr:sigma-54 dependent transcriptional regulator [Planctomycetota bacterium]